MTGCTAVPGAVAGLLTAPADELRWPSCLAVWKFVRGKELRDAALEPGRSKPEPVPIGSAGDERTTPGETMHCCFRLGPPRNGSSALVDRFCFLSTCSFEAPNAQEGPVHEGPDTASRGRLDGTPASRCLPHGTPPDRAERAGDVSPKRSRMLGPVYAICAGVYASKSFAICADDFGGVGRDEAALERERSSGSGGGWRDEAALERGRSSGSIEVLTMSFPLRAPLTRSCAVDAETSCGKLSAIGNLTALREGTPEQLTELNDCSFLAGEKSGASTSSVTTGNFGCPTACMYDSSCAFLAVGSFSSESLARARDVSTF